MKIYLIGNISVDRDSLPFKLKSSLEKHFPDLEFIETDPNENFIPEEKSIIIDTVFGINDVTEFTSLDSFSKFSRISPHDYDLLLHLQLLIKLKKLSIIKIIGLPADYKITKIWKKLCKILKKNILYLTNQQF